MYKKIVLIGATGLILLVYVILSAASTPAKMPAKPASAVTAPTDAAMYTAREMDDRIVILSGDKTLLKTDIRVSQLPKIDRIRLHEGISLFSDKELKRFIEDYCS